MQASQSLHNTVKLLLTSLNEVMLLMRREKATLTASTVDALRRMTASAGTLAEQTEVATRESRIYHDALHALLPQLTGDRAAQAALLEMFLDQTGAERGFLLQSAADTPVHGLDDLTLIAQRGYDDDPLAAPGLPTLLHHALERGSAIITDNLPDVPADQLLNVPVYSVLCVPVAAEQQVIALLCGESLASRAVFNKDDLLIAQQVAEITRMLL